MLLVCCGLFVLGVVMGSFACCQSRRQGRDLKSKRSVCLHCKQQLATRDLVPVVSWLALQGKCRYCGGKIGWGEILAEVGLGAAFVLTLLCWPFPLFEAAGGSLLPAVVDWGQVAVFGLFLLLLVGLAMLFISDLFYHELSTKVLIFCLAVATCLVGVQLALGEAALDIWSRLLAVLILSGTYLALYLLSRGKKATGKKYGQMVGDGDWLMALPLALVLGDWWLALLALTLANLLGSLVALPLLATKKAKTGTALPFGPFLITAFWVVFLAQPFLLSLR